MRSGLTSGRCYALVPTLILFGWFAASSARAQSQLDGPRIRRVNHDRRFDLADQFFVERRNVLDLVAVGALEADVHDVGAYFVEGKPRPLEPGMVLTVEPGIYIAPDVPNVSPEWRGIGVRIEDDVLVTPSMPEVLTAGIPKTVEEVRRACAG